MTLNFIQPINSACPAFGFLSLILILHKTATHLLLCSIPSHLPPSTFPHLLPLHRENWSQSGNPFSSHLPPTTSTMEVEILFFGDYPPSLGSTYLPSSWDSISTFWFFVCFVFVLFFSVSTFLKTVFKFSYSLESPGAAFKNPSTCHAQYQSQGNLCG